MARRGDDVIGFTRIFVLFVTLVILPALLMSGFGVIAILNVREVDKQRRREAAEDAIRRAEQRFVAALDQGDRAIRAGLDAGREVAVVVEEVRRQAGPVGGWTLLDAEGRRITAIGALGDGAVADKVAVLSRGATALRPIHVVIEDPAFVGVVSIQRLSDGRAFVYAIDAARLAELVRDEHEQMIVSLHVDTRSDAPIENALERIMKELVQEKESPDGERLIERRLAPPFERFTLVVDAPPSSSTTTIIVIYVVLLAIFLVTLITGVVITGRLIYEETRLSRLKTDFVSHMSHELRTPLTSIRLFIDTLKLGRATPEEQAECLELLAKETERLSEMIERVLGYARLKAGRRVFTVVDVPVQRILDDVIAAFRAQTRTQTPPAQLSITTEIAPGLPTVHVDRDAIVEALLNLLGNAWKYTGDDKRIVVFARPGRRGRVLLGVQDNGPGLPKHEHAPIFERFYQARSLLSGKQPGSGLGLAITKALVEGQGGRVGVDSEPGRGSTFWLELRPGAPLQTSST